jgi:hypothetical protein
MEGGADPRGDDTADGILKVVIRYPLSVIVAWDWARVCIKAARCVDANNLNLYLLF